MRKSAAFPVAPPTTSNLASPWLFFGATFGWTWLFWLAAVWVGAGLNEGGIGIILLVLGIFGPLLTGIGFTYLTRDQAGRRDYWQRVRDGKRIGAGWYVTIFLFVPVLTLLAALLDVLLGGSGGTWEGPIVNFWAAPWALLPSAFFATLIPFVEELGWRGYVLDRLQERWRALTASLILGVLWSIWHLPMFFIKDSYQAGLGIGTPAFWLFLIGIVPLTVVFSWVFNNTQRSTLAIILLHAMVNFTGELFEFTPRADAFSILLWFVAAIGVTVIWGADTFRKGETS